MSKWTLTYREDPPESRPNLTDSSTVEHEHRFKNCKYETVGQNVITTIIPRCYT